MGMSENGLYSQWNSHLYNRDNDQQNHWVFRGTQHFQTHHVFPHQKTRAPPTYHVLNAANTTKRPSSIETSRQRHRNANSLVDWNGLRSSWPKTFKNRCLAYVTSRYFKIIINDYRFTVSPFHPPFQDSNLAPVSLVACPIAAKSQHRRCRRGLWSQALCLRIKTLRTTTTSGLLWMFPKNLRGSSDMRCAVLLGMSHTVGHSYRLIPKGSKQWWNMMEHDLEQRWTKCHKFENVLWDYPGTWVTLVKIMGQIWSSSFSPQLSLRSKGQTAHSTSQEGYSLTWWTHHDVAGKKHRKKVTTITTNIILQHYLASSSPSIKK